MNWDFLNSYFKLRKYNNSKNKDYLFVGGCARSGTSVITNIIGAHQKIALGMERYSWLSKPNSFSLTEDHFTKSRFLNVEEGDTHYSDIGKFDVHNKIKEKWGKSVYVGDKNTLADEVFNRITDSLGEIKLIYIYRDIFDVAESWNTRVKIKTDWDSSNDFRASVIRWNNSMKNIRNYLDQGENIVCVSYEDLLFSNKSINIIFEWLGIEVDSRVIDELQKARANAISIRSSKGILTKSESDYINEHAEKTLMDEFNDKYNILLYDNIEDYINNLNNKTTIIEEEMKGLTNVYDISGNNFFLYTFGYSEHIIKNILVTPKNVNLLSTGNDPFFSLRKFSTHPNGLILIKVRIESEFSTSLQLFYETNNDAGYTQEKSIIKPIKKGNNTVYLRLENSDINGQLRIDPGVVEGNYTIHQILVKSSYKTYEELYNENQEIKSNLSQ
jgi:sulfotransferase family protein